MTGCTGFIGSSVLAHLLENNKYDITALVRSEEKAAPLRAHGIHTVIGSLESSELIEGEAYKADLVIETADCDSLVSAKAIVAGLKRRYEKTGEKGRLLQTSGTGILADDFRGAKASEQIYSDKETDRLNALPASQPHRHVDIYLIDNSDCFDLALISPPCIFGRTRGPEGPAVGKRYSGQVPLMINAALKNKQVVQVGAGVNIWSNVHIADLVPLYTILIERMLKSDLHDLGKNGYYFAENGGEHSWGAIARALVPIMKEKGLIARDEILQCSTDEELVSGFGLKEASYFVGSNSRSRAEKSRELGWAPTHGQDAIYATLEIEVAELAKLQ